MSVGTIPELDFRCDLAILNEIQDM